MPSFVTVGLETFILGVKEFIKEEQDTEVQVRTSCGTFQALPTNCCPALPFLLSRPGTRDQAEGSKKRDLASAEAVWPPFVGAMTYTHKSNHSEKSGDGLQKYCFYSVIQQTHKSINYAPCSAGDTWRTKTQATPLRRLRTSHKELKACL